MLPPVPSHQTLALKYSFIFEWMVLFTLGLSLARHNNFCGKFISLLGLIVNRCKFNAMEKKT